MPAIVKKCKYCVHSMKRDETDKLCDHPEFAFECRKHAPTLLSGSGTGWSSQLFPFVHTDDWCSEFDLDIEDK